MAFVVVAVLVFFAGRYSADPSSTPVVDSSQPAIVAASVRLGAGIHPRGLFVEPDDGVTPLTTAIHNSQHSIWIEMYELTNKSIIHALEYAHANGVDVRVILEPHPYGSGSINQSAYDNLMAADIPVHWASSRFALTHQKSMVVDGASAYVMTTNFTRSAFRANREFDVVDASPPDVAAVSAIFTADWNDRPYAPAALDPNLPLSPVDARPLLTALIASAQRTLDVYGEEMQDAGLIAALTASAERGVKVRVILPAPKAGATDYSGAGVATLRSTGVQVVRLSSLYIHAKVIIADSARAFVGSQNISASSLDRNRELGVIVADRVAIATLTTTFAGDWVSGGNAP